MGTSKTVEIVIRSIAIYAMVPAVSSLGNLLALAFGSSGPLQLQLLVADGAGVLVRLLLVVLLWLLAPALGRRIAPAVQPAPSVLRLDEVAPLGFGLVGLALSILAVGNIAFGVALAATTPALAGAMRDTANLWSGIAQLLVGLGAFVGSRGLARAFTAVRRA